MPFAMASIIARTKGTHGMGLVGVFKKGDPSKIEGFGRMGGGGG